MSAQEIVTPQPVEAEVIIETRGLSRVYPGVIALDNVDSWFIEIKSTF